MILKKIYHHFPPYLKRVINKLSFYFSNNMEDDFVYNKTIGKLYNLNIFEKKKIIKQLKFSLSNVASATDINIHLTLLKNILKLDPNKKGVIVECGAFKGATSITLSIGAKLTGRKLIVYDSFQGLPNAEKNIPKRYYPHLKVTGTYKKGMYYGSYDEVVNNLKAYGFYEVCELRKGFFNKSLVNHKEKIDFLFLDVDLVSSTKECILYLWKYLNKNSYCFSDDACDMDVVRTWFDDKWWRDNIKCKSPGYVGSGCGLPISLSFSSLGYAIKKPNIAKFQKISWLE